MTTVEQFALVYRSSSPEAQQRFDDFVAGAALCYGANKDGILHHDTESDSRVLRDRDKQLKEVKK